MVQAYFVIIVLDSSCVEDVDGKGACPRTRSKEATFEKACAGPQVIKQKKNDEYEKVIWLTKKNKKTLHESKYFCFSIIIDQRLI